MDNIKNKITELSSKDLNIWVCNDCHFKLSNFIAPNFYFHNTGKCIICGKIDDISNPKINEILLSGDTNPFNQTDEYFENLRKIAMHYFPVSP